MLTIGYTDISARLLLFFYDANTLTKSNPKTQLSSSHNQKKLCIFK